MKFKVGDRVCVPDGREGVVQFIQSHYSRVSFNDGYSDPFDPSTLTHATPPVWRTSLEEARRLYQAIESAAEAAHDQFYEIGRETSDLGYAFADERTKKAWREVAIAVLSAVGGQK